MEEELEDRGRKDMYRLSDEEIERWRRELREIVIRLLEAVLHKARKREERERLMLPWRKNGSQQRAIVQNVDYTAQTLTNTEFSDGKLQRKTLELSAEKKNYLTNLPSQRSRTPGHVEQSYLQNTQSFKDSHEIHSMGNLLSNSCGHYELNCESQSQINKRTTYDKYNRPIGPKRLSDQLQSEKLQEQNEKDKSLCEVANFALLLYPDVVSQLATRQIQSSTSKALLMPLSLQSTVQEHLALHSETHDQTKIDELLFEILCRNLSQSLNNETRQIPSRTLKILLATLYLQSTVSKFNVSIISKEVSLPPRTALPSGALLLAMFVAAAMLPYIALLVGNLTSVQRKYVGLWRPNELCYC